MGKTRKYEKFRAMKMKVTTKTLKFASEDRPELINIVIVGIVILIVNVIAFLTDITAVL
jgi:hypothetical protein